MEEIDATTETEAKTKTKMLYHVWVKGNERRKSMKCMLLK